MQGNLSAREHHFDPLREEKSRGNYGEKCNIEFSDGQKCPIVQFFSE